MKNAAPPQGSAASLLLAFAADQAEATSALAADIA
jgi:hypothetical protein